MNTCLFSLPNLSSHSIERLLLNGSPPELPPLPESARQSKLKYRDWSRAESTQAAFVNFFEGVNPAQRVAADNPAFKVHGLIAEYDAEQAEDWAALIRQKAPAGLLPSWITRSYSNHGRLIYLFEQPVPVHSEKWWEGLLKIMAAELKLGAIGYNFQPQETKPSQYFHLGIKWEALPEGRPIPQELLLGWMARAGEKYDWSDAGPVVPLEQVAMEAEERFPGRWPKGWAGLAEGQRGPRFWDPSASDPSACIIRERGCQCFTGDKAFVSWGEIFGADFCRRSLDQRVGKVLRNLWWSPTEYLARDTEEGLPYSLGKQKDIVRIRMVMQGLSDRVRKGEELSEVEAAMEAMSRIRRVGGLKPKLYGKFVEYEQGGQVWLNNSTVKVLPPHPDCNVFGMGFPRLDAYYRNLFGEEQFFRYLHWLARFYRGALAGELNRGLGLFIAGQVDAGKTFHNKAIMRQLFGAARECTPYLTATDQFNSKLVNCPVWLIDDGEAASDPNLRRKYSERLKKVLANGEVVSRAMRVEGEMEEWLGRVVVTLNTDIDSLNMLPFMDKGIQDKLLILKALNPMRPELVMTDGEVLAELPFLAAYLRDLPDEPQFNKPGSRYGTIPWIHPDIAGVVEHSNPLEPLIELLQMLGDKLVGDDCGTNAPWKFDKQTRVWQGSATHLTLAFEQWDAGRRMLDQIAKNTVWLGRKLRQIADRGDGFCEVATINGATHFRLNLKGPAGEE